MQKIEYILCNVIYDSYTNLITMEKECVNYGCKFKKRPKSRFNQIKPWN